MNDLKPNQISLAAAGTKTCTCFENFGTYTWSRWSPPTGAGAPASAALLASLGQPVLYFPALAALVGSHETAALLCFMLHEASQGEADIFHITQVRKLKQVLACDTEQTWVAIDGLLRLDLLECTMPEDSDQLVWRLNLAALEVLVAARQQARAERRARGAACCDANDDDWEEGTATAERLMDGAVLERKNYLRVLGHIPRNSAGQVPASLPVERPGWAGQPGQPL